MHTLFCYYCLFCPISILLHTLNSTLHFVLLRTEDNREIGLVYFLKFVTYLLLSRPFNNIWLFNPLNP